MRGIPLTTFELLANVIRAREIVAVFVRHGFAGIIQQIETPGAWWQAIVPKPRAHRTTAERIRLAAEELGPAFIKAGQILSMRPDLIPQPLVLELRKLQDSVHPNPFDQMRPLIEDELDKSIDEVFSEFNETPIAAASIAQVYFARLRSDGREVAVKVQRPGIAKVIDADLELIAFFATQFHQRVEAIKPYNIPAIVEELRNGFLKELDFRHEARNQQFFNAQNPFPEKVFAPAVIGEFSTRRVLVMERIIGRRLEDSQLTPVQARALAEAGTRSMLHQILIEGFFHADPHAGNLLVTADGRLCMLDWGLAGNLTRRLRYALADFFTAAAQGDAEQIVQIATRFTESGTLPDLRMMEMEVTVALRENLNYAIGHEEFGRIILKLLHIFGRNGIHVTRDYSLTAKAILSVEEAGRILDPSFNLRAIATPVIKEQWHQRWNPKTLLRNSRSVITDGIARLSNLPTSLDRLLRRLESDNLSINLKHHGLEDIDESIKSASSRIALAVIIGSLIMGSSAIITTGIKPYLWGYPALGIVGYLISAILGLWVVWEIFWHGRHK